uniref:Peptidyl-prolyl cis-trans isomerase n=1 Tax=Melopsittacus undulatus TaxID=13146 RepID=A0A8C6JLV8_MELUD
MLTAQRHHTSPKAAAKSLPVGGIWCFKSKKCIKVPQAMLPVLNITDCFFTKCVMNPLRLWCPTEMQELRGEVWGYTSSVMCFLDGRLLGDEKDLLDWSYHNWRYLDHRPEALYQAIAEDFYSKHLKSTQHVFVYLEIAIEEQPIGRLLFELFSDACPRTCENFRALCVGGAKSRYDGRELTYKNSLFHRIVKNGWIQGGDIISGKGDQGESIYGPTFEDESFSVHHKGRGILGMANKGRHTNASQFYITFQPSPYLDKKYVAFGFCPATSSVPS